MSAKERNVRLEKRRSDYKKDAEDYQRIMSQRKNISEHSNDHSLEDPLLDESPLTSPGKKIICKDMRESFISRLSVVTDLSMETYEPNSIKKIPFYEKFINACDKLHIDESAKPNYSIISMIKFILVFWMYSVPLMLNFVGSQIMLLSSYIFLAWYHDASITAGFGLSISFYLCFFYIPVQGNSELIGIQCAKCDGSQNYSLLRQTFFKSLFINYMIFFISIAFYCRADLLLQSMGILEDTSVNAWKTLLLMIPANFIAAYNELLKSYLISIGQRAPFFWLNIVLIVCYPFLTYILIWYTGCGSQGYGIVMFIRELISFIVLQIYLSNLENKEYNYTKKSNRINFKQIFEGMGEYFYSYMKIFLTCFIPYIGWEMNSLFIGQLQDNNYQGAWASIQCFCGIGYTIGGGCGQMARTNCSNLIGKKLNSKAKEYAIKSVIANFVLAIIYC